MTLLFKNNATTTLSGSINNTQTTITVISSANFPSLSAGDYFYASMYELSGSTEINMEIVKVTATVGNNWTVARAQDSTTARARNGIDPCYIELRMTAASAALMLQKDENLADLASAATARTNLGLGSIATQAANNVAITGGTISGVTLTSLDSGTTFQDNVDTTKQMRFELSGVATATTRTLTVPNASGTIALTSDLTSGYQPLDAELTALAAVSTNGLIARTGAGAVAARSIGVPAAGLTITNADGASGNPTLALANDLAAVEAITATGFVRRTAADTWSAAAIADGDLPSALTGKTYNALTLTAAATGFTIAGGTSSKTLTVSNTLTLAGTDSSTLNIGAGGTLGSAAYTASTAYAPAAGSASITTVGTITSGTWNGTAIAIARGGTGATTKAAGYNALTPITTLGDIVFGDGANSATRLAGNTTTSRRFLRQTGTGTVSAAPAWDALVDGDVPATLTGKTINGITLTANATGFSAAGGTTSKTLTVNNSITLAGTDGTTITLPATSGTLPLNNQTFFIGTTSVAINRASASLSLTGVSIDGSAGSASSATTATTATNLAGGNNTTLLGAIGYQSNVNTTTLLSPNVSTTKQFLSQTGTGTNGAAPVWSTLVKGDVGLGNVENTALSTWAGSANLATVGTISSGTWQGSAIGISSGGTGQTTKTAAYNALSPMTTLGDIEFHNGTNGVRLAGNTTTSKRFLTQTGTGTVSAAPSWGALADADIPSAMNNKTFTGTTNAASLQLSSNLTLSGGTANGVLYLDGAKAATSGSALTFDGTKLSNVGTLGGVRFEVASTTGSPEVSITSADTGSSQINFGGATTPKKGRMVYSDNSDLFYWSLNNGSEQMRLTSTGLGIGTSSPLSGLDVANGFVWVGTKSASPGLGGNTRYRDDAANFRWATGILGTAGATSYSIYDNLAGQERLVIDSSGNLGIGTGSPAFKLDVDGSQRIRKTGAGYNQEMLSFSTITETGAVYRMGMATGASFVIGRSDVPRTDLTLDVSGNLGLGVTPSAWAGYKPLQAGSGASFGGYLSDVLSFMGSNAYNDNTNWRYILGGNAAARYQQSAGVHAWFTAPSGTAGSAISFTQAMTLDASGNLELSTAGAKIRGDFSNGTLANRVSFQTNAANGTTAVQAIANGTGAASYYVAFAGSDPANAAYAWLSATTSGVDIYSDKTGTGTVQPIRFLTGGTVRASVGALGGLDLSTGLREARVAMGASDIDLRAGNYFTRTISGATTLTVSNVPAAGTAASFILDLTNGGSATITWWSGMKWAGGTAPALTASGRDVLGFFTHDGGTTWTGLLLGKDVK